ncbi:MAG: LapA family protein [Thiotrichales bacterium]|nr:LapA family protein [Thiotrichales bacterium]
MYRLISLSITVSFILGGLFLGLLNPHFVKVDFFWQQFDWPLGVLMALMLVLGMALGALLIKLQVAQLRWRLAKQQRLAQKQADELVHLKKRLLEATQKKSTLEGVTSLVEVSGSHG